MSVVIRPFAEPDYSAIVSIHNVVYPSHPWAEAEVRSWDATRNPDHLFGRWVLEMIPGQLVGYAYYYQPPMMYDPQSLSFNIKIHPAHQGKGVGAALYNQLATEFGRLQISIVRTLASSDNEASIRFLLARHFEEEMRVWESSLDVTTFDLTPYSNLEPRLRATGIEIKSYQELADDPSLPERLKDLYNELYRDVPQPGHSDLNLEEFEREVLGGLGFMPDALFLAVHDGELVGMAQLCKPQAAPELLTGLTGVKRSHRRQSIARALKVRTVAYAQSYGYQTIKTGNASTNQAMLAINYELGFVKQPSWIHFVRKLAVDRLS